MIETRASRAHEEPQDLEDAALAVALVTGAGRLAARMRAEGLDVEQKTSVSDLVTTADRAAEAYVVDTLARLRPDDGVLGEEGASRPGSTGRTWVIDPVDGTYNFASGLDYWCSALALTDPDGTILGAVHRAASSQTWLGGRDLPTTVDGAPVTPLVDRPLDRISLATYIHPDTIADPEVLEPWLALVRAGRDPSAARVRLRRPGRGRVGCARCLGAALAARVGLAAGPGPRRGRRWCHCRGRAPRTRLAPRRQHARGPAAARPAARDVVRRRRRRAWRIDRALSTALLYFG